MREFNLIVEGTSEKILAERVGETLWFHFRGETFSFKPDSRTKSRKNSVDASQGELVAPMPGKITQLRVKVGDPVDFHQVLVVMEAMKMEYTLKSPRKGTVSKLFCKVGDQVVVEQELLIVTEDGVK